MLKRQAPNVPRQYFVLFYAKLLPESFGYSPVNVYTRRAIRFVQPLNLFECKPNFRSAGPGSSYASDNTRTRFLLHQQDVTILRGECQLEEELTRARKNN